MEKRLIFCGPDPYLDIKDANLIFPEPLELPYEILEKNNLTVFMPGIGENTEHLIYLPEHEEYEVGGKLIYTLYDLEERGYDFPPSVDFIVSREAPLSFSPVAIRNEESYEIWTEILGARRYLDKILRNVRCSHWFYGKYKNARRGHIGDTFYSCLGPGKMFEIE